MNRCLPTITLAIAILGLLSACAGTGAQPRRLYQLNAQAQAGSATLPRSLGLGPLSWPEYLNRNQIIVRLDAGRLEPLESDRWAEPLNGNFERVLRENLIRIVHPQRMQAYPWALTDAPEISVPIEILQFDTDTHNTTVLRARWRVVTHDRYELVAERTSEISLHSRDDSPAAAVASQSEALAKLAQEIGQSLEK